jgi:HMG-box domain
MCSKDPPDPNLQRFRELDSSTSNLEALARSRDACIIGIADVKPKRPLSSYNYFFKSERAEILKQLPEVGAEFKPRRSHGKIGFRDLALRISTKWKSLSADERSLFEDMAAADKMRYQNEKRKWNKSLKLKSKVRTMAQLSPDQAEAHEFELDSPVFRRFSLFGGYHYDESEHKKPQFQDLSSDCLLGPTVSEVGGSSAIQERRSFGSMKQDPVTYETDNSLYDLHAGLRNTTSRCEAPLFEELSISYKGDSFAPKAIADFVPSSFQEFFSTNLDSECKALLIKMFRQGSG